MDLTRIRRNLFSGSKTKKKAEHENARIQREASNLQQGLLRLPAELRNQIYTLLLPSNHELQRTLHPRIRDKITLNHLPALLHTCRHLRAETYPLFFRTNIIVITLQHLTQHPRSPQRLRSSASLLPPNGGTLDWKTLRLEACSRCFHADGFAVLAHVDVWIDRGSRSVYAHPRGGEYLRTCCQRARKAFCAVLVAEIERRGVCDGGRALRREDLEGLAVRMDENRAVWPRNRRRVLAERFGTET